MILLSLFCLFWIKIEAGYNVYLYASLSETHNQKKNLLKIKERKAK